MDKAGLFPAEGAAFKLQITNLPPATHVLPLLLMLVALAQLGVFALFFFLMVFYQLPTILPLPRLHVLVPWRCPWLGEGSSRQWGWREDFPRAWQRAWL